MALAWKLAVDATDPHRQAKFWAAALEYEVEDNSPLIKQLLSAGAVGEDLTVEFEGRRFWHNAAAVRHPDDEFDPVSGIGKGRRILFSAVPEPKTVKNRVHLDIHTGDGQRDATVARLEALGAERVRDVSEYGSEWTVLTDPEGNEFCVS